MNRKQIIDEAVKRSQGRKLTIGSVACHPDDPISRELVAYEDFGKVAVLSWDGVTKRWPASEIFDPNDAKHAAVAIQTIETLRDIECAANN